VVGGEQTGRAFDVAGSDVEQADSSGSISPNDPRTNDPRMTSDQTPNAPTIVAGRPDCIVVRELVVDTFIGVLDSERLERQRVRFDVEVDTIEGYADLVRTTGAFVSYADIVEYITERAATGEHTELVETWAEEIATFALQNELAVAVRVTVTKPDIFEQAGGVGVSIERLRDVREGRGEGRPT